MAFIINAVREEYVGALRVRAVRVAAFNRYAQDDAQLIQEVVVYAYRSRYTVVSDFLLQKYLESAATTLNV